MNQNNAGTELKAKEITENKFNFLYRTALEYETHGRLFTASLNKLYMVLKLCQLRTIMQQLPYFFRLFVLLSQACLYTIYLSVCSLAFLTENKARTRT